jgi:hypothetical protein
MDECAALEEHFGNTDWVLNDPDPALGEIAPELLASRRTEPQGTQPTQLPQTIINLQNAPEAPAPSGLAGALSAVTTPNAFRDMAGLAGTQANAATAFQTAANLATNFGNQAAALKLAEIAKDAHAAQTADQKIATVQRAADKNLVTGDEAQRHASQILESLHAPAMPTAPQETKAAGDFMEMVGNKFGALGSATMETTTPQGGLKMQLASADMQPGGGGGGGGSPSMSPFPSKFPDLVRDTGKLQAAFIAAKASVKTDGLAAGLVDVDSKPLDPEKIPIAIVSLNLDGTTSAVGQLDTLMYFSGSLLKIGAMYAAYQLRHVVNEFAATLQPDMQEPDPDNRRKNFFKKVQNTFDPQIKNAVKLLTDNGFHQVPKYEAIFTATEDTDRKFTVDFGGASADPKFNFHHHLEEMVVNSHNPSAGFCIQALGYNWINGALEKGGFFRDNKNGIWLAGDYLPVIINPSTEDDDEKEMLDLGIKGGNVRRINSENDKLVMQVTTCIDVAKMFVLLANEELVGNAHDSTDTANAEMLTMLKDGVHGQGAPSRLAERAVPPPAFTVLHSKIGLGELKGGSCITYHRCVASEANILQHPSGRQFVTVFQNVNEAEGPHFHLIAEIIQRTMDNFLT